MNDYRALLVKYIAHVVDCEGIDFLAEPHTLNTRLTAEELKALNDLNDEVAKVLKE